jgi:hypothetical protein
LKDFEAKGSWNFPRKMAYDRNSFVLYLAKTIRYPRFFLVHEWIGADFRPIQPPPPHTFLNTQFTNSTFWGLALKSTRQEKQRKQKSLPLDFVKGLYLQLNHDKLGSELHTSMCVRKL